MNKWKQYQDHNLNISNDPVRLPLTCIFSTYLCNCKWIYLHARNTECFRVCCRKRPRTKNLYLIWNVKAKKLVFIFQTIFCHRGGCYVTTTRTILPIRLGNTVDNFPL